MTAPNTSAQSLVEQAQKREIRNRWLLNTPALIVLFCAASGPLLIVLLYSFLVAGDYGGVVNTMPVFGALFVFFAMANVGLPGTSGFVGEFMVILAAFKADFWLAFIAATTLILGAAYTLWMVKRVVFGDVGNSNVAALKDINRREGFILWTLAVVVLALGVYPAPLVDVMHESVDHLLQQAIHSKL